MLRSASGVVKRLGIVLFAAIAVAATFVGSAGVALLAAPSPAGAITAHPQDCSFNGSTSTLTPPKIASLSVSEGTKISISCSNLAISGVAALAGQGSPLALIANCNGSACSSSDQETLAENEADISAAVYEECLFGCGSTWNTSYTVPSPFKSGGSQSVITAKGDPNAVCPPTQQQVNMGLPACAITVADTNADIWGLALLKYPTNPTPAAPTLQLSSSSVAPGGTVSVSDKPCTPSSSTVCPYWWGDPVGTAPNSGGNFDGVTTEAVTLTIEICPTSGGACTEVPNPATSPVVTVTPPVYDFNTSTYTGTITSYPTLKGGFTVPSSLPAGSYTVNLYESNALAMDPGNSTNPNFPNAITASAPLTISGSSTPPPAPTASTYTALKSPQRLCDTRSSASIGGTGDVISGVTGQCANSGTPLSANTPLQVPVAGLGGIPSSGVTGVVLNVTVIGPSTGGYMTVYPSGESAPLASNLNFTPGDVRANLVTVGLGSNGAVDVVTNTTANVAVDAEGYFAAPSSSSSGAGLYNALTPARLADTRCSASPAPSFCASENLPAANQKLTGLGPQGSENVTVTGVGKVPSTGVSAVVLNVTVTATHAGGFITVYPTGSTRPTASNLNWTAGESLPNRVIVPVGTNGQVTVFNNSGNVQFIVDVNGYFTDSGGTGSEFYALSSPARILDTRCDVSLVPGYCGGENLPSLNTAITELGAAGTATVHVTGVANIPSSAVAAVANVTVTSTTSGGFLTVWPGGTMPTVSDLNWSRGQTAPNLVIATLSSSGEISIYNNSGSANVIVDVFGWFAPA